jgi:glycosyltransferase involved in cell wall biosynthesis
MKVVWVTPSLGGRGVTVVCEQAASAVSRISNHSIILLSVHSISDNYLLPESLRVECLGLSRDNIETACKTFYDWVLKERPDIILFNDAPVLDSIWPYLPSSIKIVSVLHDHAYGWVKNTVVQQKYLSSVIAVSDFVRKSVADKIDIFNGKFRTIENGSDYPERQERTVYEDALRLVFLGAIDQQKGAFDLPKILRLLKKKNIDFTLKIIGGESRRLKEIFHNIGVEHHVRWLGRLSRNRCFQHLSNSDILLMLSRGESFGMVTTEAMAMGCVPVGYNSGGTSSIVDAYSGELVKLADINALVDRIETLNMNRDLLFSKGVSSQKRSRSKYSSEMMAKGYTKLFEDLCNLESPSTKKLSFENYKRPLLKTRIYARYMPTFIRKVISAVLSNFPRLESYLRKWRGI